MIANKVLRMEAQILSLQNHYNGLGKHVELLEAALKSQTRSLQDLIAVVEAIKGQVAELEAGQEVFDLALSEIQPAREDDDLQANLHQTNLFENP